MHKYLIKDVSIVDAFDEIHALERLNSTPDELDLPDSAARFRVKRVIKRLPDPPTPVQEKQPDATGEQPTDWLEPKLYQPGEPSELDRNPDAEP